MATFNRLVIVGVGLIGGSFGLAMRRTGTVERIVGVGRSRATLAEARKLGIIDEEASGFECVADADLVMLAMPVGQTRAVMRALAPYAGPETIVTDAGSTKGEVVLAARAEFSSSLLARFVPGHPIAGTEHSGPGAAFADLYRDCKVLVTPLPETSASSLSIVRAAWRACGAQIVEMSPDRHDSVFAAVSHLPHLLAFALVDQVARHESAAELFSFAAGGFRDFTRIASSHPETWRDICLANKEALLAELGRYLSELEKLRAALQAADGAAIESVFARAREARKRWLEQTETREPIARRDASA